MQKVSIITVVYNNASKIGKTIENVLKQTYKELEYIVVDGASTDGTTEVIKKFDGRIKWISEPDKGIYDAMMKGARMATGEWLLFRNCGDFFLKPTSIEDVFAEYQDKGEDFILADSRLFRNWGYKDEKPSILTQSYFDSMPVLHPSTFVRRVTQLKYPFHFEYRNSADYCFFAEALKNGATFHYIDMVIALVECEVGATADNYARTVAENIDILKKLGAPSGKIIELEKYLEKVKRSSELSKYVPFINYYRKMRYINCGWVKADMKSELARV